MWFLMRRSAAIMVHYGAVTEMEQRVLIDVGAGPGCHYQRLSGGARETLHKMAAEPQHGSGRGARR